VNCLKVQPGDHIYVWRTGYKHHGIVLSAIDGDYQVFEFAVNLQKTTVHRTTLSSFAKQINGHISPVHVCRYGETTSTHDHYAFKSYGADEVVRRAEEMINSRIMDNTYNLLTNNCEHVAVWVKSGHHHSNQVTTATYAVALVVESFTGYGPSLLLSPAVQKTSREFCKDPGAKAHRLLLGALEAKEDIAQGLANTKAEIKGFFNDLLTG